MKLQTIRRIYDELNHKNFGGVLQRPFIGMTRSEDIDGYYDSERGKLEVNLSRSEGIDWARELVYHEMIHQYMIEFLDIPIADDPEQDHGHEFKQEYNKFCFGIIGDSDYVYVN